MLAAALPGLALGGVLAVGPHLSMDCGRGEPASFTTRDGTFVGPARVEMTTACGSLAVTTAPGSGWRLEAGNTRDRVPTVRASSDRLSIGDDGREGWPGLHGRDVWRLALPTTPLDEVSVDVNAGEAEIRLPGARLAGLTVTANAASSTVDLSGASLDILAATVNAGDVSIRLPATDDFTGSIGVNAGSSMVCLPAGLGLRLRESGVVSSARYGDLVRNGNAWQSPDYASAAHHADLTVSVSLGSIEFDPTGGCR